jgi:hypothetical protein
VVAAGIGVVLLMQAIDRHRLLTGDPTVKLAAATAQSARDEGSTFQTTGYIAIGLGIAAAAVAVTLVLLRAEPVQLQSLLSPESAAFALSGVLP